MEVIKNKGKYAGLLGLRTGQARAPCFNKHWHTLSLLRHHSLILLLVTFSSTSAKLYFVEESHLAKEGRWDHPFGERPLKGHASWQTLTQSMHSVKANMI